MQAQLTFNLPDDQDAFRTACDALYWREVCIEMLGFLANRSGRHRPPDNKELMARKDELDYCARRLTDYIESRGLFLP